MRILNQAQVIELLPMAECVELMEAALMTLSRGEATLPLRTVFRVPPGRGIFGVMPAHLSKPPALGLKAIGVFPENDGTRLDSHQGLVLLFSPETGAPIAVMDASSITAIRTAAVRGVATRALSRPEASDLAIIGSGCRPAPTSRRWPWSARSGGCGPGAAIPVGSPRSLSGPGPGSGPRWKPRLRPSRRCGALT